jgi:hypothetical protein
LILHARPTRNIDGMEVRHRSKRRLSANGQKCGVVVGTSGVDLYRPFAIRSGSDFSSGVASIIWTELLLQ